MEGISGEIGGTRFEVFLGKDDDGVLAGGLGRIDAVDKDFMKRVGDARGQWREEEILLSGHQGDDPKIAAAKGYPVPKKRGDDIDSF